MVFQPVFILILAFTIVVDFFVGIYIEQAPSPHQKKFWLWLSIFTNIGVLAVFKYYNFFADNLNWVFHLFGFTWHLGFLKFLLPIGLSFHTFQALSYTFEVYRENQKAERNFLVYALYVMFFPQLVAGPIERPQNLLHQFYQKADLNWERIQSGLRLVLWGLFKKMVVADRIAPFVDQVYNHIPSHKGPELVFATVLFAFQIYYDFSGYTDIARGTARVLGIELMKNFDRPYSAKSISEFWRRWHISLSSWFRDYVYVPLVYGGKRSVYALSLAVLITFFVSGLWHGANWTFVLWGMLNGLYIVVGNLTASVRRKYIQPIYAKLPLLASVLPRFGVFVLMAVAWVLFRASSISDVGFVFSHLFTGWNNLLSAFNLQVTTATLSLAVLGVVAVELVEWKKKELHSFGKHRNYLVVAGSALVVIFILLLGNFQNHQFIYFQF